MRLEVIARESSAAGSRAPLLFVHGSCHAAWCWEPHFLDFFAGHGFSSHAVSLRGHGQSDGAGRLRWASISDYVCDVKQVEATLPRPPVLIGHSLGGLVVQKYLERRRAAGAVLLAPSPVGGMLRAGTALALRHPMLFTNVYLTLNPGVLYSTPAHVRAFLFSSNVSDEQIAPYAKRMGRESFRAAIEMTFNRPRADRIRSSRTPMLVLGATEDAIVPPGAIEKTARAYGAPSKIFPGLGHDMMLEPGWEPVARHMLEWLEHLQQA